MTLQILSSRFLIHPDMNLQILSSRFLIHQLTHFQKIPQNTPKVIFALFEKLKIGEGIYPLGISAGTYKVDFPQ